MVLPTAVKMHVQFLIILRKKWLIYHKIVTKSFLQPALTATALTCSKCRANNHPYATFCASCGVKIEAPFRVENL